MTWLRQIVMAVLFVGLLAAGAWIRTHLIDQGKALTQADWDKQKVVDQEASLQLQKEATAEQLHRFRNAERNAYEFTRSQTATASHNASAAAADRSLHDTIDALNQRDVSGPAGDPGAAARAGEAALARELLGSCSTAHRELAKEADELRDQVTGLLGQVQAVCSTPASNL
jgi:hypothetical protein